MNPETDRPACPAYEAKLEDCLSGQLSGADAADLAEHLKTCGACAAALEDARASVRLLSMAEPSPAPGPGFARIVMARIRTEVAASREQGLWRPFVSLAWRFAASAALGLVVMVTYGMFALHERPAGPSAPALQAAEARDMFTPEADRVPMNRDEVLIMVAEDNHGNNQR